MKCPTCGGSGRINELDQQRVKRAAEMLRNDLQRDLYETKRSGEFAVSFLSGEAPLSLTRADCEELVRLGLVFQDPECSGWYHRIGWKPKKEPKSSYAAFEQALRAGCYERIIAETDEEYERGEALHSLD